MTTLALLSPLRRLFGLIDLAAINEPACRGTLAPGFDFACETDEPVVAEIPHVKGRGRYASRVLAAPLDKNPARL